MVATVLARLHGTHVFGRRARVLSTELARTLPTNAMVLDVGCGDGLVDHLIGQCRPDVTISGLDLIVQPKTHIPVVAYDGAHFNFADNSFDVVMFVDVLHHTEDPASLLREAHRVARRSVVIKDHTCDGFLAGPTLRFMDRVGNPAHGIPLPYNYWPERRWRETFEEIGFSPAIWRSRLGLYPTPVNWWFERSLHFLARLDLV